MISGTANPDGPVCTNSFTTSAPLAIRLADNSLETCEPLQVTIAGGAGPYTLSFVGAGGRRAINQTMRAGNNQYTWINRADATRVTTLLVYAVDASGTSVAQGPVSLSAGADDVTCPGLFDTEGVAGSTAPTTAGAPPPSATSQRAGGPSPTSTGTTGSNNSGSSDDGGGTSKAVIAVAVVVSVVFAGIVLWLIIRNFRTRREVGYGESELGHASSAGHAPSGGGGGGFLAMLGLGGRKRQTPRRGQQPVMTHATHGNQITSGTAGQTGSTRYGPGQGYGRPAIPQGFSSGSSSGTDTPPRRYSSSIPPPAAPVNIFASPPSSTQGSPLKGELGMLENRRRSSGEPQMGGTLGSYPSYGKSTYESGMGGAGGKATAGMFGNLGAASSMAGKPLLSEKGAPPPPPPPAKS
jgi:hypothetical protein